MSKKEEFYILDTSVLLFDPSSLKVFKNKHIVIPETVLKELDKKKTNQGIIGKNARSSIRYLKDLSDSGKKLNKDIINGVPFEGYSGTLRIFSEIISDVPPSLSSSDPDNLILSSAISLSKQYPEANVYLVTKDTSLELKAQVHRIKTDDYSIISKPTYTNYSGTYIDKKCSDIFLSKLYEKGIVKCLKKYEKYLDENSFLIVPGDDNRKATIAQYKEGDLVLCKDVRTLQNYRLKPLNNEQYCALNLLNDPNINLVTIRGPAGCGKTIMSLAAGLNQSEPSPASAYDKVMFARSLAPLGGKDQIGYLKGTLEDKLSPWLMPIRDNINFIIKSPIDPTTGRQKDLYEYLIKDGILEISALQYIRGRSLVNTFLIIDECQNITKQEIYTIVSRIGEGSKVVLLGDDIQIDVPYLSRTDNALVHAIQSFKGSKIAGHVDLTTSVRSELAKEAIERLT